MYDGKEIDAHRFNNINLSGDLSEAFSAVEARIEDLERIQALHLGPILKESIDRADVEGALVLLTRRAEAAGLTTWKGQALVWQFRNDSNHVQFNLPYDNPTRRPAFWERQFLMIAACEGVTPTQLYDDIWPNKRDAVVRLSELPNDPSPVGLSRRG